MPHDQGFETFFAGVGRLRHTESGRIRLKAYAKIFQHQECIGVGDTELLADIRYGSSGQGGVIRITLRNLLDQHLDKLRYETGDGYGDPGWTWVYPKFRLPDRRERMAVAILSFCSEPKPEGKILREFAKQGEVQVKQAIRSLAKQGKLKIVNKGAKVLYQTAR